MRVLIALLLVSAMCFSSMASALASQDEAEGAIGSVAIIDLTDCLYLDSDRVSRVEIGQLIGIVVKENQTTPYRWVYEIPNEAVLEWIHDEYQSDWNPRGMSGVGGNHVYYFRAVSAGECTIELYNMRIGKDREAALQNLTYEIIVAAEESETFTSGDFTYTLMDGQATITKYTGQDDDLLISDHSDGYPVTGIGNEAFAYYHDLTCVTVPEGVTYIGDSAFAYCISLTSITIPDSVSEIGRDAFKKCDNLTLHVKEGSYTAQYAEDNDIPYVLATK